MNKNWEVKKLGDVCELISGQHIESQNYNTRSKGIGYLTGPSDFGSLHPIVSKWTEYPKVTAQKDDILITVKGSGIGKINLLDIDEVAISRQLMAIRTNKAETNFIYLFLVLQYDFFQSLANGAAIPGISRKDVLNLKCPIPSVSEQQHLVNILDKTFAAIDKAKENAEKNLQNVRELFESNLQLIFTDKSKGWLEKTVEELVNEGDLFKPQDGNHGEIHPKKSDYVETGVPFIMAADLKDGSIDFTECKFISRSLADSLRTGFARDGDVLLSHKATIGRAAILRTDDDYVMLTPQVTYYRIKDENRLFNEFIYFYFLSPQFQREILDYAGSGSTRAYIGITRQLKLSFLLPPLSEQYSIVAKLEALSNETKRLEAIYQQKLAALDELKKSVLQKAFNSELTGA